MHPELLQIIKDPNEILEPETLRSTHPEYSEIEINRILAFATLYKTRACFENLYCFEDIVQALNGRIPDPKQIEGVTPVDLWYGLELIHKLFPDQEYSKEVLLYIKHFMNEMGVYIFPPYIDLPNPYYAKAVYLSEHGPFPLGESVEEIQAAKYLAIQEEMKKRSN